MPSIKERKKMTPLSRFGLEGKTVAVLVGLALSAPVVAEPLVEGRVRLAAGQAAVAAQVLLFDLTDLRRGPVARATTDADRLFRAGVVGQSCPATGVCAGAELSESVQSLDDYSRINCRRLRRCGWRCSMCWGSGLRRW